MEKKDCEAIKDLAMMVIRIKVAIGECDEFLEELFDKALKVAKQRLLEHMVGEVSWQAAAFIGEPDNPLQKAMNDVLKSFNGYRREYKVRKPEPASGDNGESSNNDQQQQQQHRPAKQLVTCFNCRGVGHISRNCPRKVGMLFNGTGSTGGTGGNGNNNGGPSNSGYNGGPSNINNGNGGNGGSFNYGSHP